MLKNKKHFSPEDLLQLIIQITSAMLHLNINKVMHLDLKP